MVPRYSLARIEKGEYEGSLSADGKMMRDGVGKCKWTDGSFYVGDWN